MAKQIIFNSSLGRAIAKEAKRSRRSRFHVISSISDEGKWSLVSEGAIKPIKVFTTKKAAVSFVKKSDTIKKEGSVNVTIHDRNGRIQDRLSFQNQK